MPFRLLQLALKARALPEVTIVGRVLLGVVGVFVLLPVATNLRSPEDLTVTDWAGLVLFAGVGMWLLRAAVRGRE